MFCSSEDLPVSYMKAVFDFSARNARELSISKGEELQVSDCRHRHMRPGSAFGPEILSYMNRQGACNNLFFEKMLSKDSVCVL